MLVQSSIRSRARYRRLVVRPPPQRACPWQDVGRPAARFQAPLSTWAAACTRSFARQCRPSRGLSPAVLGGACLGASACARLRAAARPAALGGRQCHSGAGEAAASAGSSSISVAEVADRVEGAPEHFRQALVNGFGEVVPSCFSWEAHGGDRSKLVRSLKHCQLPPAERARLQGIGTRGLQDAQDWTRSFVRDLWRQAVTSGLAVNEDGTPMRAAAAEVARAFLADAGVQPSDQSADAGRTQSTWKVVGNWLEVEESGCQVGDSLSASDFADFVPAYWKGQLARVDRADALRLVRQLGGDDRIGWLRSKAGDSVTGLLEKVLTWKSELPHAVLLVQVGDFFEAWGTDAVMLVQWCGLNPMARKPRAGFPVSAVSLQQHLDRLTQAELSAAVFVQTGQPGQANQPRVLRQVVTPGAPTYLHSHELSRARDEALDFAEGRPYVAMRLRADGLLYAELRPFRREVRFRENVTPEGTEALLAENEGVAWPVFVDGVRGAHRQVHQWRWFPKHRRWLGLPAQATDSHFIDACCRALCEELRLPQEPAFQRVCLDGSGGLQPLSLPAAQNLGVLPRSGVASLVDHMVPVDAPTATRRLLRRWLLAPRSGAVVGAMRGLLRVLLSQGALVLPPLQRVPPLAKVVAYIMAQTASERLCRDLSSCCNDVRTVLSEPRFAAILDPLLVLVAAETGEAEVKQDMLVESLTETMALIDLWLHDHAIPDEAVTGEPLFEDEGMQRTLERFLEANEQFRGIASQGRDEVASAYLGVEAAKGELFAALSEAGSSLPPDAKDAVVYNPFDNDLCFKMQLGDSHTAKAVDRRGKVKRDRFTTPRLNRALSAYLSATRAADQAVRASLRELCLKLGAFIAPLRAAVTTAELLVAAHKHAAHALALNWCLPTVSSGGSFSATIRPYWLGADAVASKVLLDSRGAIVTGPNMSGKSTIMRAIGAVALLSNCGFLCPGEGRMPRYRQVFFLGVAGDRPLEGVSAFGQEAQLSSALLRRACSGTLALVDEFGRGTEPLAAQASVGALLEELAARGSHFVVATHLHGVADLPLSLPPGRNAPALWRMGIAASSVSTPGGEPGEGCGGVSDGDGQPGRALRWSYLLEEGICRESFAWLTLRQFGWSEVAIDRFQRLLRAGRASSGQEGDVEVARRSLDVRGDVPDHLPAEARAPDALCDEDCLRLALCGVVGCWEEDAVCLRSQETPPAPLCKGAAVLYVLRLHGGQVYVGQSDHLQGRLAAHRRRFGAQLQGVLAVRVGSTGDARQLEATLQRRLLGLGVSLVSWSDAANVHFGPAPASGGGVSGRALSMGAGLQGPTWATTAGAAALREAVPEDEAPAWAAAEVAKLREAALYLMQLADRLQRGEHLP
uniref:DNA mismatch repair protein MSH1 n=1 Tax=Lingulaulax polyedra TaxID=160621 RepID=A0A516AG98_LINPO|nr:DNA mismatch repair protein MSH1 [Lingulodinium polyedra]